MQIGSWNACYHQLLPNLLVEKNVYDFMTWIYWHMEVLQHSGNVTNIKKAKWILWLDCYTFVDFNSNTNHPNDYKVCNASF